MSRPIRILLFVAVLGLACSARAMIMVLLNKPSTRSVNTQTESSPIAVSEMGLRILPFELTDQDGSTEDESLLEGHWTLAEFIFTNCPGACPVMTARMSAAAEQLTDSPLRYLSFSLDAERDTPEQLRTFAQNYDIDSDKWTLLTGDDSQVRKMVEEGLMLIIDKESTNEITLADGSTMKNITHPTRLFLVGPDLRVMEMYDSGDPAEVDRIVSDARRLIGGN